MKKLLIAILLFISVGFRIITISQNSKEINEEFDFKKFLCSYDITDSILEQLSNNRFIFFSKGHNGHIWSIVVDNAPNYLIFSGNTRESVFMVDSMNGEYPLISWGMDSLESESQSIKPVQRDSYWPFYTQLILYSEDGKELFKLDNAISYSGQDSIDFNKKLNRLKYFMYWNACSSDIQEKLPSPN